jgi:hypothetical protein
VAVMVQQGNDRWSILEELEKRVHRYTLPPPGFNPRGLSADQLAPYGIPVRPDDQEFPSKAKFWDEMFTPLPTFVRAELSLLAAPLRISEQLRMTITGRREASLNWSGAYITPHGGQQFTEVWGRWDIPGVSAPAGTLGTPEFRSSIWIGFDGQRRYLDSSLPQVGTAQFLNAPGEAPFSLWWQWWLRGDPSSFEPVILSTNAMNGHRILAYLKVTDATHVDFFIENRTTNQAFQVFNVDSPTDPDTNIQVQVSGATAEWIVERPSDSGGEPYELPDFTDVVFRNCFGISAHLPPGGVPGSGREQTLDGARLISMYKVERNPSRRVTIARPERPDVDRFTTSHVDH